MAAKKVSRQSKKPSSDFEKRCPKSISDALGRMCDAAALELARLTDTFGQRGIREEMLFPAIFAANGVGSTSLIVEARRDGKGKGARNSKRKKRGAPPRTDFLLFSRSGGKATHQLAIEMKIVKLTSSKIKISKAQILGTCSTLTPHYFKDYGESPERLGGVLLGVMRVARGDIGKGGLDEDEKLCRARLPQELEDKPFIAFARFHGQSCRTFAVVLRLDSDSKPNGVKNAAK